MKKQTVAEVLAVSLSVRDNPESMLSCHEPPDRIAEIMALAPRPCELSSRSAPDCLRIEVVIEHADDPESLHPPSHSWFEIVARPAFKGGMSIAIGGRNRDGIKEQLIELYRHWLSSDAPESVNP